MTYHKVNVEVITPTWQYCNLQNPYEHGKKTDGMCRFCKEVKKRGKESRCFCMLFDVELDTRGDLVEKSCLCYRKWKNNDIIDLTGEPAEAIASTDSPDSVDAKDVSKIVKDSLKKAQKLAKDLNKAGIPMDTAYEVAAKQVASDWK